MLPLSYAEGKSMLVHRLPVDSSGYCSFLLDPLEHFHNTGFSYSFAAFSSKFRFLATLYSSLSMIGLPCVWFTSMIMHNLLRCYGSTHVEGENILIHQHFSCTSPSRHFFLKNYFVDCTFLRFASNKLFFY